MKCGRNGKKFSITALLRVAWGLVRTILHVRMRPGVREFDAMVRDLNFIMRGSGKPVEFLMEQ